MEQKESNYSTSKLSKGTKQEIRRSQFVYVYGPGAIIEGINGSRLVPDFNGLKGNCKDSFFTKYMLKDFRMSSLLNDKSEYDNYLLEIPSNSAVKEGERSVRYSTVLFPAWHLCHKRNPSILYFHTLDDEHCPAYDPKLCGKCDKVNNPNVSFVRACPNGHLDEVNWAKQVHRKDPICKNDKPAEQYFYWKNVGNTLAGIKIECPVCGSSTTMQEIYKNNTKCTGRIPEQEELKGGPEICYTIADRKYKCSEEMSVLQKQSTSLRLANTRTLLKIPKYDDPVIDSFGNRRFKEFISDQEYYQSEGLPVLSKEQVFKRSLEFLDSKDRNKLEKFFKTHEVSDLFKVSKRIRQRGTEYSDSIDEEFIALRSNKQRESANFSKSKPKEYYLNGMYYEDFPLTVYGINKLTTVTAQLAYQRNPHPKKNDDDDEILESEYVDVGFVDEEYKKKWYPAFKGVGEGIFITSDLDPTKIPELENVVNDWKYAKPKVNDDDRDIIKPLFVWWHTLSHAILKSLSLYCGYVTASLYERVYIDEDGRGGILIYNTSPGDDSGMGGLVDLVENRIEFNKLLNTAMNSLAVCSNDPICSTVKVEKGGLNGAACHNCLLISETSCEHRNALLDRNFFI